MNVRARAALAVGMLIFGISGTASAQKDAGSSDPAWPSRIVFGPPVECSGGGSIESLVNGFNTFGEWDCFTGTMTALLGAPCGTRPTPNEELPYLVMIVQKGTVLDTYEFGSNFTRTIKGSTITDIYKAVLTAKSMANQTKVVLGEDGHTVYKCVPVATSFEDFLKQANVEGITVPTQIPPASDL